MVTLLRWDILPDPHTGLPMVSIVCERSFYTQEKKRFPRDSTVSFLDFSGKRLFYVDSLAYAIRALLHDMIAFFPLHPSIQLSRFCMRSHPPFFFSACLDDDHSRYLPLNFIIARYHIVVSPCSSLVTAYDLTCHHSWTFC